MADGNNTRGAGASAPAEGAAPVTGKVPSARGGWLAKIAPGVRNLVAKRDAAATPENLWVKCPDTGEMIYRSDLEAAWWVTPAGRHMRIGPDLRFAFTFDDGVYEEIPAPSAPDDPLHFTDDRAYVDRLKAARKNTGEEDAMAIAVGAIGGVNSVVLAQDFAFMGGSLGMAAGEGFIAAAREAFDTLAPSHQKAHVTSVEEAKTAETRARRVAAVVSKLST